MRYDTIVVGGGIAGLTSTAYLARQGKKVLLVEKNVDFGGLVSSFEQDGFLFEAGVRALESAGIILPMLEDLGISIDVVRSRVSVGIEDQILDVEDTYSVEAYRNLLVNLYPDDEEDIDVFIAAMKKIMKHLNVLYGIENPVFKDLIRDVGYVVKKLLPWFPKFVFTIRKINKLNKPVEDYLETMIKNVSLRDIISQHFFKGTPTFFALSYFSLYLDYFYPQGGVGKIIDALADKATRCGALLQSNTVIEAVDAKRQCVTDQSGNVYHYDNLIWAADLKTFYRVTQVVGLPSGVVSDFKKEKGKMMSCKGGESVFSLYLQVDRPLSYFREIAQGHFFYTPSRQGLGNLHKGDLDALLESWETADKSEILAWLEPFLDLNTFEISIPGLKDESLVPQGKTGLIISFIIDYEFFQKAKSSGWYDELRKNIEDKIIKILSDSVYPDLRADVIKQFSLTPISIKNRIASSDASIVGWSYQSPAPVINKIQKSTSSVLTPFANIFQAGQWAYSPSGVPMSILTGKLAADKILASD